MVYASILAGGKGNRMGYTELPKQFMMLGDKPIIIHTLEQFLINDRIDKILICIPRDFVSYMSDLINDYIKDEGKIDIVVGGADRGETMMNGCYHIRDKYGIKEDDIIITHDSVRPFLNQRIINDNIDLCHKQGAVDTVIESYDTIVKSNDESVIAEIPLRNQLYLGQTPQSFNLNKLITLYEKTSIDDRKILTDACKIFVINNEPVHIVKGEIYNFKITTLYDLKLANLVLSGDLKND